MPPNRLLFNFNTKGDGFMDIRTAKIGISKNSDQTIDRMLLKVNEGFAGGRVTKAELASWVICYFETHMLESAIEKIRKDYFDQVTYLESVIKEMKQARKKGIETTDLSSLLAPIASSLKEAQKKRNSPVPEG
jgi:hypothetical protein